MNEVIKPEDLNNGNLDPALAAQVAYRNAKIINTMILELKGLYNGYNGPEYDQLDGGKFAIGRILGNASAMEADDVLPKLQAAAYALVGLGDLWEVAALAIGDKPNWWE